MTFTNLQIPAGRRPKTKLETLVSAALIVAFSALFVLEMLDDFTPRKLSMLLVLAFWVPLLVLHEVGHAVVARALGWRVREIVIGFGRVLWETRIGQTRIRIKLAPVEGYVLPVPLERDHFRWKSLLIYAAGPGAELLLLALMLGVFGTDAVFNDSDAIGFIALESLAVAILLGAGFNLLPFRVGAGVSDGLGMLLAPFTSEETLDLQLVGVELRDASRMTERGETAAAVAKLAAQLERFPNNERLHLAYVAALSADRRTDDARELLRDRLGRAATDAARRDWWLLQARVELEAEAPSFLALDRALQQAAGAGSAAPDVLALKGAALVLRGRGREGGALLADAWRRNDGSADDAEMLAYLAIAARQAGDADARRRFREAFLAINRSAPLAERVGPRL